MMPIQTLQIQPVMRQMLAERKWLETLGRLERKDFMLHDREHWPQINLPGGGAPPQQGMYPNQMMHHQQPQQRFPPYPYQQGGAPPAKRPRHSGPSGMPGSADGVPDTSIEDEENTSLGDFFDHLSPRDISMVRYMQHHRWMEEVFSSPYASSQIVPPDLGLGLMGELKGLTEGILDPPSADEVGKVTEKPNQAKEAQPFTNLKKEQVDEFSKRVEKHLEDGRAEIEAMKKAHAEKMAEWKKSSKLMQAEKRLRNATWEGHESAVPAYRLDVSSTNGHAEEGAPTETVEDIMKSVESTLGVRIESHKESTLIQKGGLDEEQHREEPTRTDELEMDDGSSAMQQQQQQQEPMMSGAVQSPMQSQQSYQQQQLQASVQDTTAQTTQPPAAVSQSGFGMSGQQALVTNHRDNQAGGGIDESALDDMVGMGDMDGMDLDPDNSAGMEFLEDNPTPHDDMDAAAAANVPGMEASQPTPQEDLSVQPEAADLAATETTGLVTLGEEGEQEATVPDQTLPTTTAAPLTSVPDTSAIDASTAIPPAGAVGDLGENEAGLEGATATPAGDVTGDVTGVDNSLFDDGTFDDLGGMEGEGGDDGLIDFDGGMGMEDSAFGDAMHGMDANTPMSGNGNGSGSGI